MIGGKLRVAALLVAALPALSCAAARRLPLLAPEQVGPGRSPAPEKSWRPPAGAVPPAGRSEASELPAGYQSGMTLSLAQAIDVALANNPSTRTAWLQARAAEQRLGSERSAWLPEVDLSVSAGRQPASVTNASTPTTYGASLGLTYLLFDFGGRAAVVEEARQTLIAADYLHNAAIQNVILNLEDAYFQLLAVKALVVSQEATLKELQTSLDAAEARHRAGVATIADVLQARTAYSQARLTADTLAGDLRVGEGTVATIMGLPPQTGFVFGTLPDEVPATEMAEPIESLLARAAAERPDLAASRAAGERASARITEVRSSFLPSIGLTTSLGTKFVGTPGSADSFNPVSAGVALRFPLFTGFRNVYEVRAAELDAQAADEQTRGLAQQIDLDVWTGYFGVRTAAQRVRTSRDLLASAQQSLDVASGRYKEGLGTILDVLTAESALANARAQDVQARTDWLLSLAQLAHGMGGLTPETAIANSVGPAAGTLR
jgi:outer membrane protein